MSALHDLPSIDFGFEKLRDRMVQFTKRFDTFIEGSRKRMLEEKNEFARTIAEDKGGPPAIVDLDVRILTWYRVAARAADRNCLSQGTGARHQRADGARAAGSARG